MCDGDFERVNHPGGHGAPIARQPAKWLTGGVGNDPGGMSGRVWSHRCRLRGISWRSGEHCDAAVAVEQEPGGGPAVDDAHDAAACPVYEPSRRVEDPPSKGLRSRLTPRHAPSMHKSCNHRTRSADRGRGRAMCQAALASKLVNGNRVSPESFSRQMCCFVRRGHGRAWWHRGSSGRPPGRCRSPGSGSRARGTGCVGPRGGAVHAGRSTELHGEACAPRSGW